MAGAKLTAIVSAITSARKPKLLARSEHEGLVQFSANSSFKIPPYIFYVVNIERSWWCYQTPRILHIRPTIASAFILARALSPEANYKLLNKVTSVSAESRTNGDSKARRPMARYTGTKQAKLR